MNKAQASENMEALAEFWRYPRRNYRAYDQH